MCRSWYIIFTLLHGKVVPVAGVTLAIRYSSQSDHSTDNSGERINERHKSRGSGESIVGPPDPVNHNVPTAQRRIQSYGIRCAGGLSTIEPVKVGGQVALAKSYRQISTSNESANARYGGGIDFLLGHFTRPPSEEGSCYTACVVKSCIFLGSLRSEVWVDAARPTKPGLGQKRRNIVHNVGDMAATTAALELRTLTFTRVPTLIGALRNPTPPVTHKSNLKGRHYLLGLLRTRWATDKARKSGSKPALLFVFPIFGFRPQLAPLALFGIMNGIEFQPSSFPDSVPIPSCPRHRWEVNQSAN
ncbi:hypothetical protein J6590_027922 [Homalodisca vitripennis]|nr:hypothetical protein J6590_027922 [Homalodisca vitripennis]